MTASFGFSQQAVQGRTAPLEFCQRLVTADEAARVVREMSETIEALVAVRMQFEAYLPAKKERV